MKTKTKSITATVESDWFRSALKKGVYGLASGSIATTDGGTLWPTTTSWTSSRYPYSAEIDLTDEQLAMVTDAIAEQLVHPPALHIPVSWAMSSGTTSSAPFGKSGVFTIIGEVPIGDLGSFTITTTYDEI